MFFVVITQSPHVNVIAKAKKGAYQTNYFDVPSSNTTFQCEWHPNLKSFERRGSRQEKKSPSKK